jgi:hypothetical protein
MSNIYVKTSHSVLILFPLFLSEIFIRKKLFCRSDRVSKVLRVYSESFECFIIFIFVQEMFTTIFRAIQLYASIVEGQ